MTDTGQADTARPAPDRPAPVRAPAWLGALCGLLAALAALAVAELAATLVRAQASPVIAVGGSVIDATPTPLKEFAVREFGNNDKPVLIGSILAVLVVLALVTGALAVRASRRRARRRRGARTRRRRSSSDATRRAALDPFPSLVGAVVGAMALILLLRPLSGSQPVAIDVRRRQLIVTGLWVAAGSLAAGTVGRLVNSRRGDVSASRAASTSRCRPARRSRSRPAPS